MLSTRGLEPRLPFPCVFRNAVCVAGMLCCCKREGMGGFQPQTSAIWELQEMGMELWKLSGVWYFFFLAFYLIKRIYEE